MRKIAAITGTRAEYGVMKDLFQKLNNDPDIDFKIIITGQHLLSEFGNTFKEVQKDFPNNYKVKSHSEEDSRTSMAVALGKCITGMVGCFKKIDPEFVLVTGDRGEALAAAIAASHMNIPVAHLTGGDITSGGTIDNSIRIAITSFSHIHFPPTKKSRENLIKIGESPSRIFHFGNPGLNKNSNTEEEIRKIVNESEFQKNYDKILKFGSLRPRSKKEYNDWLKKHKVHESLHAKLFNRLKYLDFINDKKFALWWIEQRVAFRSKSKRVLIQELRSKGVDKDIVDDVLFESELDELKVANKLLEKKKYRWEKLGDYEARIKKSQFLARNGFDWETIKKVLKVDYDD